MAEGMIYPFLWIGMGLSAEAGTVPWGLADTPSSVTPRSAARPWIVRQPLVRWYFNGEPLPLNASECQIVDGPRWSATDTLSGDRILNVEQEYDERLVAGVRPAMIQDRAAVITLSFPRLPLPFYHALRRLRTFGRSFVVEISLFDGLDRERFHTADRQYYYADRGSWKDGGYAIYRNDVLVDPSEYTVDRQWGWVRFHVPQATSARIGGTYVWAPLVMITGQLEPELRAGIRERQASIKLTLQELRPGRLSAGGSSITTSSTTTTTTSTTSTTAPSTTTTAPVGGNLRVRGQDGGVDVASEIWVLTPVTGAQVAYVNSGTGDHTFVVPAGTYDVRVRRRKCESDKRTHPEGWQSGVVVPGAGSVTATVSGLACPTAPTGRLRIHLRNAAGNHVAGAIIVTNYGAPDAGAHAASALNEIDGDASFSLSGRRYSVTATEKTPSCGNEVQATAAQENILLESGLQTEVNLVLACPLRTGRLRMKTLHPTGDGVAYTIELRQNNELRYTFTSDLNGDLEAQTVAAGTYDITGRGIVGTICFGYENTQIPADETTFLQARGRYC